MASTIFSAGRYNRISSNDALIRAAIRNFIAAHPIVTPVVSPKRWDRNLQGTSF